MSPPSYRRGRRSISTRRIIALLRSLAKYLIVVIVAVIPIIPILLMYGWLLVQSAFVV